MKKILLLLFIFIPFIFVDNVDALTFEKCGDTVQVDESNFIYYIYNSQKSYFNNYNYFLFFKYKDGTGYTIYFYNTNDSFILRESLNQTNGTYNVKDAFRIRYNLNFSQGSTSSYGTNGYSSFTGFNINYYLSNNDTLRYYDTNNIIPVNLTKADLEHYFSCTVSLNPETKNIVFTNLINEFVPLIPFIIVLSLVFTSLGMFLHKKD